MNKQIPRSPFKFSLYASRPVRKWVVIALISVLIGSIQGPLQAFILRNLTDSLSSRPMNIQEVWKWIILFPLMYFLMENAVWRVSGFSGMRWFTGLKENATQILYEYLSRHGKEYFSGRFAGSLTNKISNAVDGSVNLLIKILWKFMPLFYGLAWYIFFASLSDWRLGTVMAIWGVFFVIINSLYVLRLQKYAYYHAQTRSILRGKIVDSLSNISLVHEQGYLSGEHKYINKYIRTQEKADLTEWQYFEWALFANGFLIAIFIFSMLGTSLYLLQRDLITIGVVVMVVAIVTDLSHSFFFLGSELSNTIRDTSSAKEGLDEILVPHKISDNLGAAKLKVTKGNIKFKSINFRYEESAVFEKFSLNIEGKERIGIVGKSGEGKTTLVSLLLRHFDLQSGAILIDGQDISKVQLESLRDSISFVPQDTSLFHRTIKENIAYGKPDARDEEIIEASKKAQAHKFIQSLPKGYDTIVGERGIKLSGGERQRIAIARAFLKNSPILILDEATSSLDSESEKAIQKSLKVLMKDKTVIAIAHRLSTLKEMDRIVVLEGGKIVEDGTAGQLLKKEKGVFKDLWSHQVSGFILDE